MKNVILSADAESKVYSVPNIVADNLAEYCIEFCDNWLISSPNAEKYRKGNGVCYHEGDFIEYLNNWIFPNQISKLVDNIGYINSINDIPNKYKECAIFNF